MQFLKPFSERRAFLFFIKEYFEEAIMKNSVKGLKTDFSIEGMPVGTELIHQNFVN